MSKTFYKTSTFFLLIILISFTAYYQQFAVIDPTKADEPNDDIIEWIERTTTLPQGYRPPGDAYDNY